MISLKNIRSGVNKIEDCWYEIKKDQVRSGLCSVSSRSLPSEREGKEGGN
jgi:hypothetical protein